jgi:hypothetical protein
VPLKISYLLMRWSFGLVALVLRGDQAKDAELLVHRQENAGVSPERARSGMSQPIVPGSLRWPSSSRGSGGAGSSR